ncbi:MAG TPA: VOC family protein [Polyangiaceae bacterium]
MDKLSFGMPLGTAMQVGFLVEDMNRELEHWTRTLRVGPFFYLPHFPLVEAHYRGAQVSPDLDVALAFSGTTCFELIHQNDDAPSPFREALTARGYGFHHWAVASRTFEDDLREREKSGMAIVASATVGLGGRCAYLETRSTLGAMLELIEITPPVEQFLAMIHAAAEAWDGSDPVRHLAL